MLVAFLLYFCYINFLFWLHAVNSAGYMSAYDSVGLSAVQTYSHPRGGLAPLKWPHTQERAK